METDGRIRSKDIGTGEVNSRVIDDLRSSNFNGSQTDPEADPGTEGWQILKNGISVFNNAIIRGTLRAGQIISGTLSIGSGGSITVGNEANPSVSLDETGLKVFDESGNVLWASGEAYTAWTDPDTHTKASSTSTSFSTVATFSAPIPTPVRYRIAVDVQASTVGTEGEWRIVQDDISGTIIGSAISIGFGGSGVEYSDFREGSWVTHDVDTWPRASVQIRRTAGTGTIFCACRRAAGIS